MCGIIGYIGDNDASPIILEALKRMEYRGYDSAGVATFDGDFIIKKGAGKVKQLDEKLNFSEMQGTIGIGHTRWATHGNVNEENAHPHWSCKAEVVVVHNGIIENYLELKEFLSSRGHKFKSQTDSEVIAHLLEEAMRTFREIKPAILSTIASLKGSYGFLALVREKPETLIAVRKDAPMIVGLGKNEYFLASDVLAFIDKTNSAIFMHNREIALVSRKGPSFFDFTGATVIKVPTTVAWEIGDVSKNQFLHYTLKEIHEQPTSIRQTLLQAPEDIELFSSQIKETKSLFITGCGTSYNAGLLLKYLLAKTAKVKSDVFLSSEIDQHKDLMNEDAVLLAISQSGETADVLEAVSEAKSRGTTVLSIVNVMGSSLTRESKKTLFTRCGPEVGVAATKSFTSQVALMSLVSSSVAGRSANDLSYLPLYVERMLRQEKHVSEIVSKYVDANDFYFIGRGDHFPVAAEGALKMKELSYVHAEGMAAGELKHGTLALIEEGTPVVLINPPDDTYSHTLNNAMELRSRGAKIIGISNVNHPSYDKFIPIPNIQSKYLYPIVEVIPLQFMAYYAAIGRKLDPDYPRNLAKSVTVI
ncbi:MAG: glutamine--fructose-6-phosphate transaminase (isomerizing) [Nitrososphaerales archaeon]